MSGGVNAQLIWSAWSLISREFSEATERFSEFFIFVWPICFFLLELGTFESNVVLAVCFIDARHHKPLPRADLTADWDAESDRLLLCRCLHQGDHCPAWDAESVHIKVSRGDRRQAGRPVVNVYTDLYSDAKSGPYMACVYLWAHMAYV